jgi:protein-disulfide isomerase
MLHVLQSRYPTQLRVVFRNFPLNPACNAKVQHAMHPAACEAALGGVCAFRQDKFQAYYEAIFENQETLNPGRPLELAKGAGLDMNQFQGCIASPEAASAIARDVEEGSMLDVQSTPTLYLNGHHMTLHPLPVMDKIIEAFLK